MIVNFAIMNFGASALVIWTDLLTLTREYLCFSLFSLLVPGRLATFPPFLTIIKVGLSPGNQAFSWVGLSLP